MTSADDVRFMGAALALARQAAVEGEVPVGAVVVHDGVIVASGANRTEREHDPTAHAELVALREAVRTLGRARLLGCTLFVTMEPCAMCAGAIVLARVDRVVFGAWDDKAGMAGSVADLLRHPRLNHRPEVRAGVEQEASAALLRDFFTARRGRASAGPGSSTVDD